MKPFATVGDVLQHKHERLATISQAKIERSKIKLDDLQKEDMDNETSLVREIEMELEIAVNHNQALIMQFFTDFQLYGLHEAIMYLEGYENQGMAPQGAAEKIKAYAHKALEVEP